MIESVSEYWRNSAIMSSIGPNKFQMVYKLHGNIGQQARTKVEHWSFLLTFPRYFLDFAIHHEPYGEKVRNLKTKRGRVDRRTGI